MKKIKYIFLFFCLIILIFFLCGLIVIHLYEEKVINYAIKEINKDLRTRIVVHHPELSFFPGFPNATVKFADVYVKSVNDFNTNSFKINTDTLLYAKYLYLELNILDILCKKYYIKRINVYGSKINIYYDNKGYHNYHFWQQDTLQKHSNFYLKLRKIQFIDINLKVWDKVRDLYIHSYADRFFVKGDFRTNNFELSTTGTFFIKKFVVNKINYVFSDPAQINLGMYIIDNKYSINTGKIKLKELLFDITGYMSINKKNYIDLKITGNNLKLASFISLLPQRYKECLANISGTGDFYFNAQLKGLLTRTQNPHLNAVFGVNNATITNNKSNVKIKDINVNGIFSNGKNNNLASSYLKIQKCTGKLFNSFIKANGIIENFNKPKIFLSSSANINLEQIKQLFSLKSIEKLNGTIKYKIDITGHLASLNKITNNDLKNILSKGNLNIKNLNFITKNNKYKFEQINGNLQFNNKQIFIKNLKIVVYNNKISINGFLKNLYNHLFFNETAFIHASISSGNINLDNIIESKTADFKRAVDFYFPENISCNIFYDIDNFKYQRITANNIHGILIYKDNKLKVPNIDFSSIDGEINGSITIHKQEANYKLNCISSLSSIDIKKLFYVFKNFGQNFITNKHIDGKASIKINLSAVLDSNFSVLDSTILCESKIEIKDGELINFTPLEKLSSFVELSELKEVDFSTLKNTIYIRNKQIYIPEMDIQSSVFNISISGTHSFDNKFSYKIKVLLSELLARKARKSKKENIEFGIIDDQDQGRTSLFLTIAGTADNYKIKYDAQRAKQHIKECIKQEKREIKSILHEEFGLFKNDTDIIKYQQQNKAGQVGKKDFIIEWDDEEEE